ncbi:uncharacterized protein FIBRA_04620 [Fibroporia radiculosa]|uniref:Protein kinase domain-containing protein n=1 Tax=Fibroporia radiculosa TaxID=599839 RepID=J4G7N7_9APHY|nr:uncharacterized protein FIBRA_04620 [Fibroporia radiculosa]CCM02518.1 predicted protein [Fibroporia radiculosa]
MQPARVVSFEHRRSKYGVDPPPYNQIIPQSQRPRGRPAASTLSISRSPLPSLTDTKSRTSIHSVPMSFTASAGIELGHRRPGELTRRRLSDAGRAPLDLMGDEWELGSRPQVGSPERQKPASTRERVTKAVTNVLGTTAEVAHELLAEGECLLEFAPIPGLAIVARSLLAIWDAYRAFKHTHSACEALTDRCAVILLFVRREISRAGDRIAADLKPSIKSLEESFGVVRGYLEEQSQKSLLKRFVEREEIRAKIQECHQGLTDALAMFGVAIQFRILQQGEKPGELLRDAIYERPEYINTQQSSTLIDMASLDCTEPSGSISLPGDPDDQTAGMTHEQIRNYLAAADARQLTWDLAQDRVEMWKLMEKVLAEESLTETEIIETFQIGRDEIPETIAMLQEALAHESKSEIKMRAMTQDVSTDAVKHSSAVGTSMSAPYSSRTKQAEDLQEFEMVLRDRDRRFIEVGLKALSSVQQSLPSWAIMEYEVIRDERIGIGYYSDVYKGMWRNRSVAIKVLGKAVPQELFMNEVEVWKELSHPNVLEFLGASFLTSDPPWFFVSPYMKNRDLVSHLKKLPSLDSINPFKMIHEITRGMAYLHREQVLHGDLKGTNVLIDDQGVCVIADFGQSKMKSGRIREIQATNGLGDHQSASTASRLNMSKTNQDYPVRRKAIRHDHEALRWQAPELMAGRCEMTQQTDVYAFAMCCIEILGKGEPPWSAKDDNAVRQFVLRKKTRPKIPQIAERWMPYVESVIKSCWDHDPSVRPSFEKLVRDIGQHRLLLDTDTKDLEESKGWFGHSSYLYVVLVILFLFLISVTHAGIDFVS